MDYCEVISCYSFTPCPIHELPPPDKRRPSIAALPHDLVKEEAKPGMTHGMLLGTTVDGVKGFNCNYDNNPEETSEEYERSSFSNGIYTGMKWQCVEFARRYWIQVYGVVLPPVSWAAHIFKMTTASRLGDYWIVPIRGLPDKGTQPPRKGDLLIYASTPNQRVGHVAVIVEVLPNSIRVAEQNNDNDQMWKGGTWADEISMVVGTNEQGEKTYTVTHEDPDLETSGWMRLSEPSEHTPRPAWVRPETQVPVHGIYDEETTKALQTLTVCFADGQHGRFTNMNLQAFLKEHTSPDVHLGIQPKALIGALRLLLTKYWPLATFEGAGEGPLSDSKFFECEMKGCVCAKITKAHMIKMPWERKEGEVEEPEEVVDPVPCNTTKALQTLMNNVDHGHDLNFALEAVLANNRSR
jgi:hypothetical protein